MTIQKENGRIFRRMNPVQYPGNDREFMLDCPHLFAYMVPKEWNWTFIPGPGCAELEVKAGYAPLAVWQADRAGATLVMRGEIEADLKEFAFLRVRALAGKTDTVAVKAEIDGCLQEIVPASPGVDEYDEYTGPIRGSRLTAVEIHCRVGAPGRVTHSVMWVMGVKAGTPAAWPQPDAAWTGLLAEAIPSDPRPTLELTLNAADVEWLRGVVREPQWAKSWADTLAKVEKTAQQIPETTAGPVIPVSRDRYGRPNVIWNFNNEPNPVLLAFAGLVEQRADWLKLAARWALTWSECERWVYYGVEHMGEYSAMHGCFGQAGFTSTVAQLLDWCGSVLTDQGRAKIARAIHELGVRDLDDSLRPGSYTRLMNQGIIYESALILGATAVRKWYPDEYPRRVEEARKLLADCLQGCFAPDGAACEGSGYWYYTLSYAIPLITLLARASGRSLADETPPCVAASGHWAFINRRTDSDTWIMLPHADGGYHRVVDGLLAAFFAGPLGQAEFREAAQSFADKISIMQMPRYRLLMKSVISDQAKALPPTLTVFPASGQVDVRQADPQAGMRIYFLGGPRRGHAHNDKNSFILEAHGKTLLLDRATPSYTHPACTICAETSAHNAVAPDGLSQNVEPGKGGAILLRAEEAEGAVVVESDAAGCWPGLGKKVLRRLVHVRPSALVVEDVVEWSRPVVTRQYWQSHGEWREQPNGWCTAVDGVELLLTVVHGAGAAVTAAPYSVDGNLRPVQRLVVEMPRAAASRLVVLLRVRKSAESPWDDEPVLDGDGRALRLKRSDGAERVIRWSGDTVRVEVSA